MIMINALGSTDCIDLEGSKQEAMIKHPFIFLNNSKKYYTILINKYKIS
jgi:hypothetical protein